MEMFFQDVFEYHHHFNQRLIDQLITHEMDLPERTIPLFCHVINAHQIWNSRIMNQKELQVQQIHPLARCKSLDKENLQQTKAIIQSRKFDESIKYTNSKGKPFYNTIAKILFHISNHSTHHKGQIIADFRQSGISPLSIDYIFYKR